MNIHMVNGLGSQCFEEVMSKVKLRGWCLTKINMVLGWKLRIFNQNIHLLCKKLKLISWDLTQGAPIYNKSEHHYTPITK